MDDYSQDFQRSIKLRHRGAQKFSMGPHAPCEEWFEIDVNLKRKGDQQWGITMPCWVPPGQARPSQARSPRHLPNLLRDFFC